MDVPENMVRRLDPVNDSIVKNFAATVACIGHQILQVCLNLVLKETFSCSVIVKEIPKVS